jgi:hypothetical protein
MGISWWSILKLHEACAGKQAVRYLKSSSVGGHTEPVAIVRLREAVLDILLQWFISICPGRVRSWKLDSSLPLIPEQDSRLAGRAPDLRDAGRSIERRALDLRI